MFSARLRLPGRGGSGGERIGRVVEDLRSDGWTALPGVGNLDHVLIGPAGLFTIETRSHQGRLSVDRLDERWLLQAYSKAQRLQRVAGGHATPLLVLGDAYRDRSVRRRRGVMVLPSRMLGGYLRRRPAVLRSAEVDALRRRIAAAMGETAARA